LYFFSGLAVVVDIIDTLVPVKTRDREMIVRLVVRLVQEWRKDVAVWKRVELGFDGGGGGGAPWCNRE
jgi:hypothetical protein